MALTKFEHHPIYDRRFVGRQAELGWLRERTLGQISFPRPIFVSGVGGIGKTALVEHFLASSRIASQPFWVRLHGQSEGGDELDRFVEELYLDIPKMPFFLVVDEADALSEERLRHVISRIYNIKATRGVIFIGRSITEIERGDCLHLNSLPTAESRELLAMLADGLTAAQLDLAADHVAAGHPLAISLLSAMLRNIGPDAYGEFLAGRVYEFSNGIALPKSDIITSVQPALVSATDRLVDALKQQPKSVYDLEPRQFEELLAHLLNDMGWEVELTPASNDGGKDILAYLNTTVGKMLCLVEAKRYRADRKVGVDLVRSLYGTLCDHKASSAMLVTTSSFTSGAREFQKRNQYQLALRDYGDVVQWIQDYGRSRNGT